MKKIIFGLLMAMFVLPVAVMAEEYVNEAEIDLDSIRYNKANATSEIRMKIYNENYQAGGNEMYYAMYYLKMDCTQKMYKPMMIEGYNKRDELMLVDYEPRAMQPVASGSNLEQAYNFACQIKAIPDVPNARKK